MKFLILLSIVLALAVSKHYFLQQDYYLTINSMQNSWTAGYNKRWESFTFESIKSQMGTFLNTPEHIRLPLKQLTSLEDLPESFDSREKWPGCESIKEVRDQSTCGSCWAFGAAEAMSDRLCIASGQTLQTRISTEDLLSCCGECGFGCQGGFPDSAWSYFQNAGLVTGNEYGNFNWCRSYSFPNCEHHTTGQYEPCGATKPTPKCIQSCHSEYGKQYRDDKIYASSAYSLSGEQQIMTEILQNGPVEAAFMVYEDFLSYKSGVYRQVAGGYLGGHAVKIIGWGVENGVKYWLIANSWNEDWGNQGFFKIVRGEDHLGIESQISAGLVSL